MGLPATGPLLPALEYPSRLPPGRGCASHFCCPQPPHPVALCRLGTFTLDPALHSPSGWTIDEPHHPASPAPNWTSASDPLYLALSSVPSHLFSSTLDVQFLTHLHSTTSSKFNPGPPPHLLSGLLPGTLTVPYTCLTQPQLQALLLLCCLYSSLLVVLGLYSSLYPINTKPQILTTNSLHL